MDVQHKMHLHDSGIEHKMQRVYIRKKTATNYQYVPVGWRCPDCGQIVQ